MAHIEREKGSRKLKTGEVPLSIDSEVFEEIRIELTDMITTCFKKLGDGMFDSGDVTMKIVISLNDDIVERGDGERISISRPVFKYKTALVMKEKYEGKGEIYPDEKLVEDDEGFYLDDASMQVRMDMEGIEG